MDIGIEHTKLITLRGSGLGIIDDGAISFSRGKITYVGKTGGLDTRELDVVMDGGGHVTMPGLVNAHTHTGLTILRGGAQDVPEIEWMNRALGPLAKHLKEGDQVLGSKLGVIEGLRSGITTFGEYAYNVNRLIREVYEPYNVRVAATETINEVVSDKTKMRPDQVYLLDSDRGNRSLDVTNELFDEYRNSDMVDILYGPQALDMVSVETLHSIRDCAIRERAKIHMHVAQGERERLQVRERYGSSTVKALDELDMLDEQLIAVHCHDTTEGERRLMVESGVSMVGCPSSIAMIDGMVPPVGNFLSMGGKVALGTDQAPGPGTHNMFREMRTISLLTKTLYRDPTLLPPWETLRLGCLGGAEVLGMDDRIGTLEEGKAADIITIDLSGPNLTPSVSRPFDSCIPNLVYSATGFEVDNVIINGEFVIRNGDFVNIDEEVVLEKARSRAVDIFSEAEKDWEEAGSLLVDMHRKGFI